MVENKRFSHGWIHIFIDVREEKDAICTLMLVLAIDAEKSSRKN